MAKIQRIIAAGQRIRVLIVDDSVVIRQLVTHALSTDPAIEIVGVAANGNIALAKIGQLHPDALTLDIEMPEMNGLETLKCIRRDHDDVRVIMFSTLTERGAAATLEALALGADDYVAKVSNEGSLDRSLGRLREELIPKIKQFFAHPSSPPEAKSAPTPPAAVQTPAPQPAVARAPIKLAAAGTGKPTIVAIGVSTGGPAALARILPLFPASFPLPIMIVQHMPPLFTKLLAERLNDTCALEVKEAVAGATIKPGEIWIAQGDHHMTVTGRGADWRVKLDQGPHENSCRPAVDVLFASLANTHGSGVLAAVLTGMGRDGQRGASLLKAKGASVLAQDEASSVVWGMPGSVVEAGLADMILPLDQIPNEIIARVSGSSMANRGSKTAPTNLRSKEVTCPR